MKMNRRMVMGEQNSFVGEECVAVQPGYSDVLYRVLSILVKVLFLCAWGYGLFQGGFIGLFCVICGIIVLTITTFI